MRAKKFVILYAVVLFLVVFAITFNCICSIARFDVTFEVSSMTAEARSIQQRLEEEYGGKSYLFFGQEDVESIVAEEGGNYMEVTGFSKTFPNVIHARVEQKHEVLSLVLGGTYYAIAEDNTILAVRSAEEESGSGNVAVYGFDFPAQQAGETFSVSEEQSDAFSALLAAFQEMDAALGGAAGNVLSITYDDYSDNPVLGANKSSHSFYIEMREGGWVWIINPFEGIGEKIASAMNRYLALNDAERTRGYITATNAEESADYTAETPSFLDRVH